MTTSDRKLIVLAIATLGLSALAAAAILGALVIVRLHSGDDFPPGVAAYLTAFVGVATSAGALLAPSPLSKTTTADPPQPVEVVNAADDPVPVDPAP